jgi:hypothetical protein
VTALLGAMPTPASAGDVAPLIEDAARALPKVRPVEVRLPKVGLTALEESKYGIDDAAAIAALDDAKTREVNAIDSAASEVGNAAAESSEVKGKAKECVKESFQKAADEYAKADEEGTTYPVFDNAFYLAVYGCLAATFPHASEDDVGVVADYLTGRVSQPARDAVTAAPTTFANWLAQVAAAMATALRSRGGSSWCSGCSRLGGTPSTRARADPRIRHIGAVEPPHPQREQSWPSPNARWFRSAPSWRGCAHRAIRRQPAQRGAAPVGRRAEADRANGWLPLVHRESQAADHAPPGAQRSKRSQWLAVATHRTPAAAPPSSRCRTEVSDAARPVAPLSRMERS